MQPPPPPKTVPSTAPPPPPTGTVPSTAPPPPPLGTVPSTAPPPPPLGTVPSTAPPPPPLGTVPSTGPPPPPTGTVPSTTPPAPGLCPASGNTATVACVQITGYIVTLINLCKAVFVVGVEAPAETGVEDGDGTVTGNLTLPTPTGGGDQYKLPAWVKWVKFGMYCLFCGSLIYLGARSCVVVPGRPSFQIHDIGLYGLNLTQRPSLFDSRFIVTVSSYNPNRRIVFSFENMVGSVLFENHALTMGTPLPSSYLGHRSEQFWTVLLSSQEVPLSPPMGLHLRSSLRNGTLPVLVVFEGRLKWHLGALSKGSSHVRARCAASLYVAHRSSQVFKAPRNHTRRCTCNWSH